METSNTPPSLSFFGVPSTRTIIVNIVLFVFFKYLYDKSKKDRRLVEFAKTIPGPRSLPIVGNGLDFFFAGPNAMKKIMEYTEKYGPVFRLWMGKHLVVGLSDENDLEEVFSSSKMIGKSELFRSFQAFWGDGLISAPVHIWKRTRKLHQPAFVNSTLPTYVNDFNEKIHKVVELMKKSVNGPEFDAWDYMPYLSFDIIAKTALDIEMDPHEEIVSQFHNSIKHATEISFLRMFRPWLHIKPICDFLLRKKISQVHQSMMNLAQEIVKLKNTEITTGSKNVDGDSDDRSIKPFLSGLHRSQIEFNSKNLIYDEITTMITGGTETTAITNSFFLLAVAANPQIQDRLFKEIYEVFGNENRPADADDLPKLPYLDQVLKETLRRFVLVPVVFRQVEADSKIGTRIFPAGTELMISAVGVHFNPKNYPDPWKFNPENFSPEAVEGRHKLSFLPFSAGPRNCIGMNYALLEMKLTLIALLRAYKFHTTVKLENVKMSMGFLMTSLEGYKMSITPRQVGIS